MAAKKKTEQEPKPSDPIHDPENADKLKPNYKKYPVPPPTNPDDGAM